MDKSDGESHGESHSATHVDQVDHVDHSNKVVGDSQSDVDCNEPGMLTKKYDPLLIGFLELGHFYDLIDVTLPFLAHL